MMKSEPIVFFGTEEFSAPTLEKLIAEGFNVALVVTKPDSKRGRNQIFIPKVKQIALDHDINVVQPTDLTEITPDIRQTNADFGVLVSYGRIIPDSILDIFRSIINIHPSLLPKYRGASPIEQAILNGDDETGISIMQLVSEMDAGDVYLQETIQLNGTESKPELYKLLSSKGAELLVENFLEIISGKLLPEPQQGNPSYAPMIKKSDGTIDTSKSAEQIEREIRAYLGWPGSFINFKGKKLIITEAKFDAESGKEGEIKTEPDLRFYCKSGSVIVKRLTPEGKRNMTAEEFLRGL